MAKYISNGIIKLPPLETILPPDRIRITESASKEETISLLAEMLAGSPVLPVAREKLVTAIFAREKLMSTGIGLGVAFPHVRLPEAKEIAASAVLVRNGIADYQALDSEPVRLAVMIVAPEGQHAQHLRLLAAFSSKLKDHILAEKLFSAENTESLHELLTGKSE